MGPGLCDLEEQIKKVVVQCQLSWKDSGSVQK